MTKFATIFIQLSKFGAWVSFSEKKCFHLITVLKISPRTIEINHLPNIFVNTIDLQMNWHKSKEKITLFS